MKLLSVNHCRRTVLLALVLALGICGSTFVFDRFYFDKIDVDYSCEFPLEIPEVWTPENKDGSQGKPVRGRDDYAYNFAIGWQQSFDDNVRKPHRRGLRNHLAQIAGYSNGARIDGREAFQTQFDDLASRFWNSRVRRVLLKRYPDGFQHTKLAIRN